MTQPSREAKPTDNEALIRDQLQAANHHGAEKRKFRPGDYLPQDNKRNPIETRQHPATRQPLHGDAQILYGPIPRACYRYGMSRSRLYILAGQGLIRFIRVGGRTLVDFGSVESYLASCPTASIRPQAA